MEDQYTVDALIDYLDKKRLPSGKIGVGAQPEMTDEEILDSYDPNFRPPGKVKVQPVGVTEATPLENEGAIKIIGNVPKTDLGEFQRSNANRIVKEAENTSDFAKSRVEKSDQAKAEDAARERELLSMLMAEFKNVPKQAERELTSKDLLRQFEEERSASAKNPNGSADLATQLLYSLAPAALAAATGGYEGADAGGATQKFAQGRLSAQEEAARKEREFQQLSSGSRMKGIASLAKTEADAVNDKLKNDIELKKLEQSNIKTLIDFNKFMSDKNIKDPEVAAKMYIDSQKEMMGQAEKGLRGTVGVEQKAVDAENAAKQKELDRKSQERRAGSVLKKPTEYNIKSAESLASMKKAEEAFQRMKSDLGYVPSMKSKSYEIAQNMFQGLEGTSPIGLALKNIANDKDRRQIQAELDFLAPLLRKESGAAISVGEYLSYGNRFFDRKGDDVKTIAEKEASRKQAMENAKVSSGNAPMPGIIQPNYPPPAPKILPPSWGQIKEVGGKKYIYKDGTWKPQN